MHDRMKVLIEKNGVMARQVCWFETRLSQCHCYFISENRISLHDLQATILHLLGMDAHKFRYPYQGLQQRLIGPTEEPKVRRELLA